MADLQKLVDELSSLTVLEAAELSKLLEEKWGVSAAAPVAAAAAAPAAAAAAAPVEEQTEFTVILAKAGDKKINVIKEVRTITGLGPEGSQGPGRGRAEARQGRREQGRGREDQKMLEDAGRDAWRSSNAAQHTTQPGGGLGPPARVPETGQAGGGIG